MDKKIYHSFDISIAKGYGLHAAIVFNYLKTRIEHLKSLGAKKHGPGEINRTWLKESLLTSTDFLKYIPTNTFIDAIESLKESGLIVVSNLTDEAGREWDFDIWYAISCED